MAQNNGNPLYDENGRLKRIVIASQSRLEEVEYLADRFFREVIGMEYADCLITDESDLYDFQKDVPTMLDRIEAHYFADARGLGTTRIVALLEFLHDHGVTE